jgi:hypothetical protein
MGGMPVLYQTDDKRRLLTVSVSDPYTAEDVLAVVDRQASEGLWEYALLYDVRSVSQVVDLDPALVKARIRLAGEGRPRGAVAIVIGAHPDRFRAAMLYSAGLGGSHEFEVLITPEQVDDWIRRHARRPRG